MKRLLFSIITLVFLTCSANAATCFWVGGTGNWDNSNTASWASSSGGTAGTCAAVGSICKNTSDVCTFDGSSGGSTVTVCGTASANCPSSSGNVSVTTITSSAFTGTLDFATRNPAVTLATSWTDTGAGGTHTINMGSGTWTFSGGAASLDVSNSNLTLNQGASTVAFTASSPTSTRSAALGTKHLGVVTVAGEGGAGFITAFTGAATIDSLTITSPNIITFQNAATMTIGTLALNGSASNSAIEVASANSTVSATLSISTSMTATWGVFKRLTFSGAGAFNITNSIDLGGNSGASIGGITTGGGGGRIIGG